MDWISKSRLTNWFIAVLLAVNIISVSIIWMQINKKNEPPQREQKGPQGESVNLLKQSLKLSDEQTERYAQQLVRYQEKTKVFNDQIAQLKTRLVEELFKEKSDTILVNTVSARIGILQAEVEKIRFYQMNEFLSICTPEQKIKFRPIMMNIFGRKGQNEPSIKKEDERREPRSPDRKNKEGVQQPRPNSDNPPPPSLQEKIRRYDERLQLTDGQKKKIQTIFETTTAKMDQLKGKMKPGQEEFEVQKKAILEQEDKNILSVLNEEQKQEFIRMQERKRK